jgi:hypothetical protein
MGRLKPVVSLRSIIQNLFILFPSESQVLSPGDAQIVDWGMRIGEFSNLRLILRQAQDAAW